jgi:hypothetical protein
MKKLNSEGSCRGVASIEDELMSRKFMLMCGVVASLNI